MERVFEKDPFKQTVLELAKQHCSCLSAEERHITKIWSRNKTLHTNHLNVCLNFITNFGMAYKR